jgi:hypothetical protein
MHDPYVKFDDQNVLKYNQQDFLTHDLDKALADAEIIIVGTAHKEYLDKIDLITSAPKLSGLMDACNIYKSAYFKNKDIAYAGIGRGAWEPAPEFIGFVMESFRAMEKGLALELNNLINFYNDNYAHDEFNKVNFADVQYLARTCSTGCEIANPEKTEILPVYNGFTPDLTKLAFEISKN